MKRSFQWNLNTNFAYDKNLTIKMILVIGAGIIKQQSKWGKNDYNFFVLKY